MNKERYYQIILDVYREHCLLQSKYLRTGNTIQEFINKIKTDKEFSEKWGLKIEERELSHDERIILMNKKLGVTDTLPQYYNTDDEMDKNNVPTKLITVTYNK
jgi:hypothetical protein